MKKILVTLLSTVMMFTMIFGSAVTVYAAKKADDPIIWTCFNVSYVENKPTRATKFTLDEPCHLTSIMTYHWNYGEGKKPGKIRLKKDGAVVGTWKAEGTDGQGGVKNANWIVYPDIDLEPGDYEVLDSDKSTWSTNTGSDGMGFAELRGIIENGSSDTDGDDDIIWTCFNISAVKNKPSKATKFTLDKACHLNSIMTYHWNDAEGKNPGKIRLKKDGVVVGTWKAEGTDGQGGVKNANWIVYPDIDLEPGDYEVLDSDKSTWSTNAGSDGMGFAELRGSINGDSSIHLDSFDFSPYNNLLVNGDAEKGSTTGWNAQETEWEAASDISGVKPHNGSYFFWPKQTSESHLYQDVDISDAGTGNNFVLGAYMRDYTPSHGDESELILQLLDGNKKTLDQDQASISLTDKWSQKIVSLTKTSSAKYVRVILHAKRNTGTDCDSYFDDVILVNAGSSGLSKTKNSGKSTNGTSIGRIQGEDFDADLSKGVAKATEGELGNLGYIEAGSYAGYADIDFGKGVDTFIMHTSKPNALAYTMELRLDSPKGTLIGSYRSPKSETTTSWDDFMDVEVPLTKTPTGVHDLYFVFKSDSSSYLMDIDYFSFTD